MHQKPACSQRPPPPPPPPHTHTHLPHPTHTPHPTHPHPHPHTHTPMQAPLVSRASHRSKVSVSTARVTPGAPSPSLRTALVSAMQGRSSLRWTGKVSPCRAGPEGGWVGGWVGDGGTQACTFRVGASACWVHLVGGGGTQACTFRVGTSGACWAHCVSAPLQTPHLPLCVGGVHQHAVAGGACGGSLPAWRGWGWGWGGVGWGGVGWGGVGWGWGGVGWGGVGWGGWVGGVGGGGVGGGVGEGGWGARGRGRARARGEVGRAQQSSE